MRRRQGFNLVELLIAVAVVAILVGSAVPLVNGYLTEANRAKAMQDLDAIVAAIVRYQKQSGQLLTGSSLQPLVGLTLTEIPVDPWGHEYFFDGDLGVVGSAGTVDMGLAHRTVMTQYSTYLIPLSARLVGGGFGLPVQGTRLEIRLSKPYQVIPGREALVVHDLYLFRPAANQVPIPLVAFGFQHDTARSRPEQGLLIFEVGAVPSQAHRIPAEGRVGFAGMTAAIAETGGADGGNYSFDPLLYQWGTQPFTEASAPVDR